MSKFQKKRGKAMPAISTASLPDIIFMLLFFFMVVTVLRTTSIKVDIIRPSATELTKLQKKSQVATIYVGKPKKEFQNVYGTRPMLQLGDSFSNPEDIPLFIENFKASKPENVRNVLFTSLKVDGDVTMGIVQDIKTKLRQSSMLKVNYSATPKQK